METLKPDCRHFTGYAPCKYYWNDKSVCWDCKDHYDPIKEKILLVKLGGLGDVMRTTCLVRGLKKKYPNSHLTWWVDEKFVDLIKNNKKIDRILVNNPIDTNILLAEEFDIVINTDKYPDSCSITNLVKAKDKRGFGLNKFGKPYPLSKGAEYFYKICLDNWGLKKENRRTIQEMLFEIAGLEFNGEYYDFELTEDESKLTSQFKQKYNIENDDIVIGFNTGCNKDNIPMRKWTKENHIGLIKTLSNYSNVKMILLGGPDEIKINKDIKEKVGSLVIWEEEVKPIREFATIVNACDIVTTGDTSAMHIALALSKKVIVFFGPSPGHEIEIYGKGKKFENKELDCLICYNQFPCERDNECMTSITPEEVHKALLDLSEKPFKKE